MTATTRAAEAGLVARAQRGEADAFAALYEAYAPEVERYLWRRLGRRDDELSEDLTAEVFVRAFERLDRYVDRGLPFAAWLYRLARNLLIDHLRVAARQAADSLDRAPEVVAVADRAAARDAGRVLDHLTLGPARARLTPDQRRALELRFLEDLPTADVAAILGKTEDGVKKLQARGLAALRRLLAADGTGAERGAAPVAA